MLKSHARIGGLFSVDLRRMLTQRLFYIMLGVSAVLPVLILVMTTAFGGTDTSGGTNASVGTYATGGTDAFVGTYATGGAIFTSVWQAIGSTGSGMSMDLTSMCNINLIYFLAAVFACLFTADDFRSGYCKNIFAIREKKADYVFSKIRVCFIAGVLMLLAYFAGTLLGGRIAGLSFAMEGFAAWNLVMCMISKIFVMAIFVAIFVLMGVIAKRRAWMSILLSFTVGMFMYMVIPMMTSLDAGLLNVIMCLAGGIIFTAAIGSAGRMVLDRTDIL